MKGTFIENLPKVYGLYTGGFILFIILMAILEQVGVSAEAIGIMFVAFTIVIYGPNENSWRCGLRQGANRRVVHLARICNEV